MEKQLEITPLGTVSPYCKDNKNCPGILIEYQNNKILLDCGEGISRLLNFPDDLNNLIIILSHLHKDHYSGLSSLAYASYCYKKLGCLNKRIKVYIPQTKNLDFEYLINYGKENYLKFIPYNEKDSITQGNMKITFKSNPHQLKTYSTKISTEIGTIVYSADTGYKNNCLEEFAKNADLLICESTFLKNQCKKNDTHLYAYEAATIAKKANVKKLMLTHFWPEIDKLQYVKEAQEIFENTIAAEEDKKLILKK